MLATKPSLKPSLLRPPRISLRWMPVFRRNLLVWRKLAIPSLIGNIAEPLIWLVAFGRVRRQGRWLTLRRQARRWWRARDQQHAARGAQVGA